MKTQTFPSSRIESLTDGIFGFTMTLLVTHLTLPRLAHPVTNAILFNAIMTVFPQFFIFLLSFFLLAVLWGTHHRQFSYIVRSDGILMWINMLRLLFVILVPFSSELVGNYGSLNVAVLFFNLNIFFLCVISYVEWEYAYMHGLAKRIKEEHRSYAKLKNVYSIVISAVACVVGFFNPDLSLQTFLLIPLGLWFLKHINRHSNLSAI